MNSPTPLEVSTCSNGKPPRRTDPADRSAAQHLCRASVPYHPARYGATRRIVELWNCGCGGNCAVKGFGPLKERRGQTASGRGADGLTGAHPARSSGHIECLEEAREHEPATRGEAQATAPQLWGRSHTKPSTPARLIHEIPIRTFTERQDAKPGEVSADLVGHDGGRGGGEHAFTCSDRPPHQWTEPRAVLNKAQKWGVSGAPVTRAVLPFLLHARYTTAAASSSLRLLRQFALLPLTSCGFFGEATGPK